MLPEKLRTGDRDIDQQHDEIFRAVNDLRRTGDIEEAVHEISAYFAQHFAMEESLAESAQYPELHHHHELHKAFFDRWIMIRARWLRSKHDASSRVLLIAALEGWLADHVLNHDIHLATWMRERGANGPGSVDQAVPGANR